MLDFSVKSRELLVAFANSRKPEQLSRTATFTNNEEPDLVPKGYYAVVKVELRPFESLRTSWVVPELAEAAV